ncbi:MAG: tetratricopeptide repeat protein [Gammaproteobacteria bacterium]|nr:tetratricopeptide repeat protein [Gammaproteobacteria bacterium]
MHTSIGAARHAGRLTSIACRALALLLSVLFSTNALAELYSDKLYAINILSQTADISDLDRKGIVVQEGYALYTTEIVIKGATWNRLRLGFFGSQKDAVSYINTYLSGRSGVWVAAVTADEYLKNKTLNDEQLFIKAQGAFANHNYQLSATLYKKIIAANDRRHKASALVSLGEIYEKSGDIAAAVDVYTQYIDLYPEALNLPRIKDRKAMLDEQLHAGRPWVSSGEISQSMSRHTNTIRTIDPLQPEIYTEKDSIITYLNYTGYKNYIDSSLRLSFKGDYDYSLINQATDQRLSANQLSLAYSTQTQTTELGRQACSGCGINGILDGVSYAYAPVAPVEFKLSAGHPVDYSSNAYNNDRTLYSLNIDTRRLLGDSNLSAYYVKQDIDGIADRQAAGLSFNYASNTLSVSSNIDYDLLYNDFNYALINLSFVANQNTTYNLTFNQQRNMQLSLRNALYGQPETTIQPLLATMSIEDLRMLSEQRTGTLHTLTMGAMRPVSDSLQTSVDFTLLHRDEIPLPYELTGNIPGYGFVIGAQLIGSNLLKDGDLSIASSEYMKDSKNESILIRLTTRYPASERIELDPALALRHTDLYGEMPLWKLFPSLALSYQAKDTLQLQASAGIEYADPDLMRAPSNESGYFYELKYRLTY